jgi:hypothetical protein
MCYSLPAGGKTSLAVEPAVLDAASLLEELTAAAEATSAARARAATLNKEESILVKMLQAQLSTTWNFRCQWPGICTALPSRSRILTVDPPGHIRQLAPAAVGRNPWIEHGSFENVRRKSNRAYRWRHMGRPNAKTQRPRPKQSLS